MFEKLYQRGCQQLRGFSPSLYDRIFKYRTIAKYLIAGGTAAGVNIGSLYVLTDILHIWYITSSILAFILAFFVSFTFQKFWTFRDKSTEGIHSQAGLYLVVTVTNLGLNTLLIYTLVEKAGLHYLVSQIIAGALIACESFFVYRHLIFKKSQ